MAAFGLIALTLGGFLGRSWWIFDLLAHFRVQYLVVGLLLLAIYLLGRRIMGSMLTGGLILLNFALILPLFIPPPTAKTQSQQYRLFLANVLTSNPQHERTRQRIAESDADIVALLEVNQGWLDDLNLTEMDYSYSVFEPREDNFGIALYSRFPTKGVRIIYFGTWGLPSIHVQVILDEFPINLIVTHPVPPKGNSLTWQRNLQMSQLVEYLAEFETPIIVAGDLNATSWSPYFGEWLEVSNLRDSRRGFGVQPTYLGIPRVFTIPIDHVLISSDITVHDRYVAKGIGSDHLPVIMDFSLQNH